MFQALYDFDAEVVVTGHNHHYERFAPMDPAGVLDNANGIRQFVAGMGGASHYGFGTPQPNSEVRNSTAYGVLKFTLHAGSYDWQFVPVAGADLHRQRDDRLSLTRGHLEAHLDGAAGSELLGASHGLLHRQHHRAVATRLREQRGAPGRPADAGLHPDAAEASRRSGLEGELLADLGRHCQEVPRNRGRRGSAPRPGC